MDTNLPNTPTGIGPSPVPTAGGTPAPQPISIGGPGGGKEREPGGSIGISSTELTYLSEVGKEVDLPHEVLGVGVKVHPTHVPVNQAAQHLGVQATGHNAPLSTGSQVTLPLSDDQIATALHASITDSVRWLAEWCIYKLKQLHVVLKYQGGHYFQSKE